MSDKIYDLLCYIQRLILPACITFIGVLAGAWGWDKTLMSAITITLGGVVTLLGVILQVLKYYYNKQDPELPEE